MLRPSYLYILIATLCYGHAWAQTAQLSKYNVVWTSPSKNSGESMPCGGGDVGLNVWVENGDLLFYVSRSGTFDENNTMLKLGRMRIKLFPNPFAGKTFRQELSLQNGAVNIEGENAGMKATVKLWVDVFRPVIHVEVKSSKPVKTEAIYESWRFADRFTKGRENNQSSWKWAKNPAVKTSKDEVAFQKNDAIQFYHRNSDYTIFDTTVVHEGLAAVKNQLFNPLKNLTFGGAVYGKGMQPAGSYSGTYQGLPFKGWKLAGKTASTQQNLAIYLHTAQSKSIAAWQHGLDSVYTKARQSEKQALQKTQQWWTNYWKRSYIVIDPDSAQTTPWQAGRNYQLFRYMLGCNAYGQYPTKFNGGLFTYDPQFTDTSAHFTPDFRNWGGGLMTAQNQRLVYWPMLKSGDWDMMPSQFNFYLRSLHNAELRSQTYWGHAGACFTEQLENFGLPNATEYGWKRPAAFDKGMEYNAWLEYEWDTVLEFCLMMLENERYGGRNVSQYVPFIESCLTFFDEHYQYLARNRGSKALDGNGQLVLYPGSGAETYKMAYNSTSTIAALQTVLTRLLELPHSYLTHEQRERWLAMLKRIPSISFREFNGHKTIAPAQSWERINNTESTQLYPIFPWGIYGVGKPGLDIALNTWKYDTLALKFRSGVGWKQDNIFAARLGLTDEAVRYTLFKLKDSGRRFPAFWGPGFDWTPDHNWGGSGMIGLQEMLLQTNGKKIMLLPAWPKNWDVHFKLHASYQTTIEGTVKHGKLVNLAVWPKEREKDVVNMWQ